MRAEIRGEKKGDFSRCTVTIEAPLTKPTACSNQTHSAVKLYASPSNRLWPANLRGWFTLTRPSRRHSLYP